MAIEPSNLLVKRSELMKGFTLLIPVLIFGTYYASAQIRPNIKFDPVSGNFIIRYQAADSIVSEIFIPATKIDPRIRASAYQSADTFHFAYTITNMHSSRQKILTFIVDAKSPIYKADSPNVEWKTFLGGALPGLEWSHTRVSKTGAATRRTGIPPDSSVAGFSFASRGLPGLTNSYFQGLVGRSFQSEFPQDVHELIVPFEKFPTNYVLRMTIGPVKPPDPFKSGIFLDTLLSYIHQSYTLGWINKQSTASKYLGYFNSAKTSLQQNNVNALRATLGQVLSDVNVDSASNLTSEAYALIRYNTEYLLLQLTKAPSGR